MSNEIPKVCPTCKWFVFSASQPGYSSMTPGSDMAIYCGKSYWDIDDDDTDESYRKKMLTALICPDYELVQFKEA
jgi:hypothetical protein